MKLTFVYAAMNAGKSTHLLQVAHNYEENGGAVVLFAPALDDRAGLGYIGSRLGIKRAARTYDASTDFAAALRHDHGAACVLVDEAQFLTPTQVRQLHRWVHKAGVPVMCFGLRSDFCGESFPGAAALLTLADTLQEIRTVCRCGKRATMNIRTDGHGQRVRHGEQVLIGGNDHYRQVCARCFYCAT